jgi:hypothetical protein
MNKNNTNDIINILNENPGFSIRYSNTSCIYPQHHNPHNIMEQGCYDDIYFGQKDNKFYYQYSYSPRKFVETENDLRLIHKEILSYKWEFKEKIKED